MHQSLKEQRMEQAVRDLLQPERREADALAALDCERNIALFASDRKETMPSSGGKARFA
jgi:hypothetical protein